MILTFREMQRQVQAKIQNTGTDTTDADDILPKIKDWINTRYYRIYRSFFWKESIETYNLTLTAAQSEYAFDRDVGEIITIFDTLNGKTVTEDTSEQHFREHAPSLEKTGNVLTGDPCRWRPIGTHTVKAAVGDAGEKINIVSSVAGDVSPNAVRITGLVGSVEIGENLTLTGTTTATTTNTFDANQKLLISVGTSDGTRKTSTGKITVSGNTSSTVFTLISPYEYAHKYYWFKVSPKPDSDATQPTWEIWYQKEFRRLENDNDIAIFDCSTEIVQGAFADALREDGLEQEASVAEQMFVTMTQELQSVRRTHTRIDQFRPVGSAMSRFAEEPYNWTT